MDRKYVKYSVNLVKMTKSLGLLTKKLADGKVNSLKRAKKCFG